MTKADKYSYDLTVGQELSITDPDTGTIFKAKVVGADHYNEVTAAPDPADPAHGLRNKWVSYTLTSDNAPSSWGERFWAVDSQKALESGAPRLPDFERAFYVASQNPLRPQGVAFEDRMSGRVDFTVVGEALHSQQSDSGVTAQGTLFTFRDAQSGKVWAEEVFVDSKGNPERMVFDAKFSVDFE